MSGYELIPAMQALREGNKAEARRILTPILDSNPTADAWLMMAKAQETDAETIASLHHVLELDPDHDEARRMLEDLGASVEDAPPPASPTEPTSPSTSTIEPDTEETVDPDAEGVYEMLWDCKFCGTTKLLGKSQKFCPVCGATQDPSWRYFPADEDKVAVKDHKFVGVDVVCGSCGNLNSGDSAYCTTCGAPLESGKAARKLGSREKAEDERFAQEDLETRRAAEQAAYARGESLDSAQVATPQTAESQSGGGFNMRTAIFGLIGLAILGVIGFIVFSLFATQEVAASVVDHSWERTISIERLEEEDRNRECDEVPASSRDDIYRRQMEVVGSERVQVGEECRNVQVDQGDGTFRQERQCDPVYESRDVMGEVCYYTVLVWDNIQPAVATGDLSDPLEWPPVNIRECSREREGCERESGRTTDFYLHFETEDADDVRCEVEETLWRNANIGEAFNVEITRVGNNCRGVEPVN